MEDAEREEEEEGEEEEEESPKELEQEEEEIAIAGVEGLGFLHYWLWEEGVFAVKKSRFGVRLNSERWKMDRQFSHSTRSQLQRRCVFLGGCSVFKDH